MEKLSIDMGLARLEEIVKRIENESLPLEETMKLFEEGKAIITSLEGELQDAEKRIEELEQKEAE